MIESSEPVEVVSRVEHVDVASVPPLFKYIDAPGAVAILKNHELWCRCPLEYEPGDSRADLFQNFDVDEFNRQFEKLVVRILFERSVSPVASSSMGRALLTRRLLSSWTRDLAVEEARVMLTDLSGWNEKMQQRLVQYHESVLRAYRVLCLTEDGDSDHMWTHYAKERTGAKIQFRYVPELDSPFGAARKVRYVEKWPVMATPLEWAEHVLDVAKIDLDDRTGSFMYKLAKFRDEREWRFFLRPKAGSNADDGSVYRIRIDPPEIVSVQIGARMSVELEREIREAVDMCWPGVAIDNQRV